MAKRELARTLFWTFLGIFVVTAAVTLLGVTSVVTVPKTYLTALFTALILEVVGSIIALFRLVFGLTPLRMALDFVQDRPAHGLGTCTCTIKPSHPGKRERTQQVNLVMEAGALVVTLPDVGPGDSVELEVSQDGKIWRSDPLNPFLSHADMHLM